MAGSVNIKLDMKRLDAITKNAPGRANEIVGEIAFMLEADVKTYFGPQSPPPSQPGAPPNVDTGALRASIKAMQERPLRWLVADGVEYGVMLEYGTPHMAPRPWMRLAVDRVKRQVAEKFKGLVK